MEGNDTRSLWKILIARAQSGPIGTSSIGTGLESSVSLLSIDVAPSQDQVTRHSDGTRCHEAGGH